jgi:amino acid adenylation domain-containing protein
MSDTNQRLSRLSPAQRKLLEKRLKEKQNKTRTPSAIAKRKDGTYAPLSFAQQRLWLSEQIENHRAIYNNPFGYHIRGNLDTEILQKSIHAIIKRHEVFRTLLMYREGKPVLKVIAETNTEMQILDIAATNEQARLKEAMDRLNGEAKKPFNLEKDLPVRVYVIKLTAEHHILLISVHHMIMDGWSKSLFLKELSHFYSSFIEGGTETLAALSIQYGDFASWQFHQYQSGLWQHHLDYWGKQLQGLPQVEFPTDFPRPARHTVAGRRLQWCIPPELTAKIADFKEQHNVTLFITLLTAFNLLLSRYSGSSDIVLGTHIAGRQQVETESMMGCFYNNLVLRSDGSGNPSVKEFLQRVKETALAAYEHQDIPFEKLVELVGQPRDVSRTPLYQVMFHLRNFPSPGKPPQGLSFEVLDLEVNISRFDLSLEIEERKGRIHCAFDYNIKLFSADTIKRLWYHYLNLLTGMIENPSLPIAYLPLLSDQEKQQILVDWNESAAEFPLDKSLHDLFTDHVTLTPDNVAVVLEDQQITYKYLFRSAQALSKALRARGIEPGHIVGLCIERSIKMIEGIMGILASGAAYLPIDPAYPKDRRDYMLKDSAASLVIDQDFINEVEFPGTACSAPNIPVNSINPNIPDLAYVIYTSGSTGKPKGVVISHYNVVGFLYGFRQVTLADLSIKRIGTSVATFSFDTSVEEFFSVLCFGGTLHILQPEQSTNGEYFADYLIDRCINVSYILPDLLEPVALNLRGMGQRLSLLCLLTGLAPKKKKSFQLWRELSQELRIINAYGPTEVTYGATAYEFTKASDQELEEDVPIGRAFPNYEVYILDTYYQPVPVGVVGEIYIAGIGMSAGYLNHPELTENAFILNIISSPFKQPQHGPRRSHTACGFTCTAWKNYGTLKFISSPFREPQHGARRRHTMYKTGDLGKWLAGGDINFLGRKDLQVKIRGYRIEPGEIEKQLLQHPHIKQVLVIASTIGTNSNDLRLVAYIVPHKNHEMPSYMDLRSHLKERLPDYMIPSFFVQLNAFPLMINGKINHAALPTPEYHRNETETPFRHPETAIEKKLAVIWSQVLSIPLDQIGVTDNFFDLGGHSLLAAQITARVMDSFGIRIPLRNLFETPFIRTLAGFIDTAEKEENNQIQGGKKRQFETQNVKEVTHLPLSYGQQRLYFIHRLEPDNPVYNFVRVFNLEGALDIECLQKSFDTIFERHEVLRTVFETIEGRPVAVFRPGISSPVEVVNLETLTPDQQETKIQNRASALVHEPVDLSKGPLMRLIVMKRTLSSYALLWMTHHIVSDGWSMGVFFRELSTLYNSYKSKLSVPLAPLSVQYAHVAYEEQERLNNDAYTGLLNYWRKKLDSAPTGSYLLTDRPRQTTITYTGSRYSTMVPMPLLESLKQVAKKENATLFMVLLAGFNALLYRYSGEEDIIIGSPIANRPSPEYEKLIGFFVNTLVLRTQFNGTDTFKELLSEVRTTCLDAYGHQELPFEKLVEWLNPPRDLSMHPFFQVMLVLQNMPPRVLKLNGIEAEALDIDRKLSNFDLTLFAEEGLEGLNITVEFNSDLFDKNTIERLLAHYIIILESIAAHLNKPIHTIPLISQEEMHQLAAVRNGEEMDFPKDQPVHRIFEQQVELNPDRIALVGQGLAQKRIDIYLTFETLNRQANEVMQQLHSRGVGTGIIVAIIMPRSVEMIISVLAIMKAGATFLPIDPNYPQERIDYMLQDSGASLVINEDFWNEEIFLGTSTTCSNPANPINSDNLENPGLLYVAYTSGSTGKPKGVMMGHQALMNLILFHRREMILPRLSRTLQFSSLAFDISFQEMFTSWSQGGCVFLINQELRQAPRRLWSYIITYQVDRLFLPMVILEQMALAAPKKYHSRRHIQEIITAGEQLQITPAIRNLFSQLENCTLQNQYGPTETHVVTGYTLGKDVSQWPLLPSIGRPFPNTSIIIIDPFGQPVPIGVAGELMIQGDCLADGYLNQPELTAKAFIMPPAAKTLFEKRVLDSQKLLTREMSLQSSYNKMTGRRLGMYKTGDLARWLADGNIQFLGRLDHQFKINGIRIEPGEIEHVLMEHSEVQAALVKPWGNKVSEKRLVAYFIPSSKGTELKTGELRHYLKQKLPHYMIPSLFIAIDAIPLTSSGKTDLRALPDPNIQIKQDTDQNTIIAPRDEVEQKLCDIWIKLLKVNTIGIDDNFFDLGGFSMLAIRLFYQIETQFGKHLPVSTLFQDATIEKLALLIRSDNQTSLPSSLVPIRIGGSGAPFFFMHHAHAAGGLLDYRELALRIDENHPVYGIRPQTEDTTLTAYKDITKAAKLYAQTIRSLAGDDHIMLGGHSFGGIVALETARELLRQGQTIAMLAIIEARAPGTHRLGRLGVMIFYLRTYLERAKFHSRRLLQMPFNKKRQYFTLKLGVLTDKIKTKIKGKLKEIPIPCKVKPLKGSDGNIKILKLLSDSGFVTEGYPGKITLIKASIGLPIHEKEDYGWRKYADEGVEIYEVHGEHGHLIKEPYVRDLAEKLNQSIKERGLK